MPTHFIRRSLTRGITAATAVASLATGLAACGGNSDAAATPDSAKSGEVVIGRVSNGAATETTIKVSEVKSVSAELPAAVKKSGKLEIGIGALPAGFPPLAYVGSDQKTLTGAEPDFGRLVASVLGLKPEVKNSTWENLFVGIDSGKVDVAFSNVTDTEERKKKYEFASYRQDNLAFIVPKKSTWNFDGNYENLAGRTIAVGSGTNQEKILLEWKDKLAKEGKKLTIKYFQDSPSTYLALNSGKIDASFGPNPGFAYHNRQVANTPNATRIAGTYSGAGGSLQGLIAATAKKDSGLAKPLADAINHLIKNGQYAEWLKAYNLSNEAVAKSEVNPPGLPLDNS
ncbi:transporter substrate-binding domain-containing protein [Streptomyces sp. SID8361]|uniref:ABC transporter substrate-binding protein n=1 Tax=Streptomyces TaxID=1883 RepID=UPI00081D4CFB|nr:MULTISPECIES: ABC transporter substrate-binding protein [unclassified Streptomyces]AUA08547.1 Cystine-binding periplasmic protein precursor [Streptomyces sp. M56]MYU09328.1 transporter substrate-binding domain-containing protein [Streptomyces sp. SID8361]MYX59501.1 transporter substrate-binding domain-containing protein [Streptomyces sp. SID8382]SCF60872.1 amino acid ABC transporter substrate-binding protein, PAAT family [Streptomyces sp. MnatMP-M27]